MDCPVISPTALAPVLGSAELLKWPLRSTGSAVAFGWRPRMSALTTMSPIFGAVWVIVCATALLIFRMPVVRLLFKLAISDESEEVRRRDLNIGVALLAAFAYVLAATGITAALVPPPDNVWPLAFGIPICGLLAILYWIRFQNAGLSVLNFLRR